MNKQKIIDIFFEKDDNKKIVKEKDPIKETLYWGSYGTIIALLPLNKNHSVINPIFASICFYFMGIEIFNSYKKLKLVRSNNKYIKEKQFIKVRK